MVRSAHRDRDSTAAHRPLVLPLEPRLLLHGPGQPDPLTAFPAAAPANFALPSAAPTMPLSSAPQLSSRPSAPAKLYLDFRGINAFNWGGYNVTNTPAYDTDGDATTFSQNEIAQMQQIWSRVAEKYSPFNINVTTVDPVAYPYNQVVRVVVGGDGAGWAWTDPLQKIGGLAFTHGYTGATSNTAFVFPQNLGSGFPKYVAEAIAHEAGHTFGLEHQSVYDVNGTKTDEYRGGRNGSLPNAFDPIMGFSYYATRGLWSNGTSFSSTTLQNDLGVIGSNNFGFRADDHGNDRIAADALNILNGATASGAGVIENSADVDYFKFNSDGGMMSLTANVAQYGAMLDLKLSLLDAAGNLLSAADTATLGESVSAFVPAGEYYLAVASHGGYGDIGQYTITGSVVPEPVSAPVVILMGVAWFCQRGEKRSQAKGKFGRVEIERELI